MANFLKRSIAIKWEGSDHKIAVTNDLCNHLESTGINLFAMQIDLNSGQQPKFFLLGNLITQLLRHVGVPAEQSDVMAKLTQEPANSVALYTFARSFISMVFPEADESEVGKPEPETAQK
tara:strand:+ start:723 stop:1082 length:360 start_codon:yes stop_codon:yes gene_type:complete